MSDNIFNNQDFNSIFGNLFGNNSFSTYNLAAELDKLYWTDKTHYIYRLEKIKETHKVLRNDKGQHKVYMR